MRATVLVDDFSKTPMFETEHGLSICFDLAGKRYLLDVGASSLFLRNASRAGIDLSSVDALFLSHAHRDHAGGLPAFLKTAPGARVVASEHVFQRCFSIRPTGERVDIGVPDEARAPCFRSRFVFHKDALRWNESILVFSDVSGREFWSETNSNLMEAYGDASSFKLRPDEFRHEQNLLITTESGRIVLATGCSHRGIVNIMERARELAGRAPDVAIGGFHLTSPSSGRLASSQIFEGIAERLSAFGTRFYFGHCSGAFPFGERFGAGDVFEL